MCLTAWPLRPAVCKSGLSMLNNFLKRNDLFFIFKRTVIFVKYFKQCIEYKVNPYDSWVRTRYIPSWICTFFSEDKLFVRGYVVEGVYLFSSILHNVASSSTRTSDFIVFINPLIYGTGDFKDHKKHTKDDGGIPPYWQTKILRYTNIT